MDTTGKSAARQAAERLREALDGRYQGKQYHTQATITAVARDSAGRAVSATAIVDGVAAQSVAISAGASIAPGDTWIVRNAGGASLPRWEAARRLRAAAEVQAPDALPTLPTPAGLAVLSDLYRTAAGREWRAYLRCSWLGIGAQYRVMGYDVQYMSGSPETLTVITATDRHPVTLLDGAIDDTQTVIPRDPDEAGYQDDFPSFGRIQIESERIDYLAVTAGEGDSGTGTGAANSFTDGTKSWDADQWADYALTDSAGDVFLVTANTGTVLTVAGTPASGAYTIKPAFSGCTRAAGGTAAAAHDDDTGVGSLSVGITIPELPPDTDYNVRVRAHSAFGGLSAWTAWASVTTAVDTLPPPVLTGMAHTPLTPDTVRLSWSKSSAKDRAYYEVAYSMAPGGLGPGGVYETVQTVNTYHDVGWPTNRALYWKVRAVDGSENASDYCAEQTAYTVAVALPELSNPFFEEGNGAPDDWTLDSDGPVTTTWVADGGWTPWGDGVGSKAIRVEIGAADGSDVWVTPLKSAIFAIQQGVEYVRPGLSIYLDAVTDNALAFTVYQYSDAIGTPATEPLVRQVVNQSADRLNDWWHPGITAGGTYTVPAGSDVTHIAIAFEVNLDETHAQTVLLDNAVCDPVPAEMYKGVEAHATYHLPGGPDALATAAANTIVPDAGAAEGSAASFARSDHTHAIACAAASTLSVSTTNSEGAGTDFARATHLHTITSSSNPGAAASLLASDASGYLTLVRLNISENLMLGADAGLTRHAANQLGPLSGDAIRSSTYTSGVAGYLISDNLAEFANARIRGELHAAVFVKDMIDAHAGTLMVGKSAGSLAADMAVPGSGTWYMYLKDPPGGGYLFADGDICYIKSEYSGGVAAIWFTVSARADMGNGTQRYTCTYNSGTRGITYPAGAPVTDWGVSGDGLVTVSADGTIGAGPNLSIITHAGSPWSATTLQGRFGNMNGAYGVTGNYQGMGIGDYTSGNYLKYDTNGGFLLRAGDGTVGIDATGISIEVGTELDLSTTIKFLSGSEYMGGVFAQAPGLYTAGWIGLELDCPVPSSARTRFNLGANNDGDGWANLFTEFGTGTFAGLGIGFGYSQPSYMLDVIGTARFSGNTVIDNEGGLYIGEAVTPIHAARSIIITGNFRARGGLYVGSEGGVPTAGTVVATDYMVALGGMHVGGTSDPGTDNLIVDLDSRIGGGLYVGGTGVDPAVGTITATGDITAARHIAKDPTKWGFLVDMSATGEWANRGFGFGNGATRLGGFDAYGSGASIIFFCVGTSYDDSGAVRFYPATGDVRTAGGLYVGSLEGDPAAGWGYFVNGLYIGDSTNAYQTKGITVSQGSATDEILALKNSGVAHGMTAYTETDTFARFAPASSSGGISLVGLRATGNSIATAISGWLGETASTTKANNGYGVVHIAAGIKSGSGVGLVGANGNLLSIASYTTTRFIFDAEGDAHSDVQWTTFDTHDDLALLEQLESSFQPVRAEFGDWLEENRQALLAAGIVGSYNDDEGRAMVNWTRLAMLHTGAIRQIGARLERYERELIRLGADPQALLN